MTTKADTSKITAFHGVFEKRLGVLIKKIKKLRKEDPSAKDRLKELLGEAKKLKKTIKKEDSNKKYGKFSIQVPLNGTVVGEIDHSGPISITDSRLVGGLLIIECDINK